MNRILSLALAAILMASIILPVAKPAGAKEVELSSVKQYWSSDR